MDKWGNSIRQWSQTGGGLKGIELKEAHLSEPSYDLKGTSNSKSLNEKKKRKAKERDLNNNELGI